MEMVFQASNNLRSGGPRGKLESVRRLAFGVARRGRRTRRVEVKVARERKPYQGDH